MSAGDETRSEGHPVSDLVGRAIGSEPLRIAPLRGGCVSDVYRLEFEDRAPLVAKVDDGSGAALDIEGFMLEYLAPHLPVPEVCFASPDLLLMNWMKGETVSAGDATVEDHAAQLLADLHDVSAAEFGLDRPTLIAGLPQPNPPADAWVPFFAEHRLTHMAREAHVAGRLSSGVLQRVEALAGDLSKFLCEPEAPSLLHGDVWSGNVLARGGAIQAFLDPAIYFGHAEVELAFITMFSTFGDRFFAAYDRRRPIASGFMEERRHIYNLYPYLVHTRLFGGSYARSVASTLSRFGY